MATIKKASKVQSATEAEVLAQVQSMSLESVSGALARAQSEVQSSFAGLTSVAASKFRELDALNGAIALKADELARLHEIQVNATTLEALTTSIAETKANWQKEQEQRAQSLRDEATALAQTRTREQDAYAYKVAQERKQAEDAFAQSLQDRARKEALRVADFDRNLQVREGALQDRETEVATALARFANFDAEVKAAATASYNTWKSSAEKDTKHALEVAAAQNAAKEQIALQEKKALEAQLGTERANVVQLQRQVEALNGTIVAVTSKALDSASGAQTTAAVQNLATIQAQNSGSKK